MAMEHRPVATPAVACTGLVKRFGAVLAVDRLDLAVQPGECFGLLGPNGAGKTTTVEILQGLQRPDEGAVQVLGTHWGTRGDRALRARIGVQLQETQLADKLTVAETARLFRSFHPKGRDPDEVLDLLGLRGKAAARVHQLSGGQRQRLALTCALVGDPELLFLDEPTTGMDPQARLRLWEVIERFLERGGTVLLTTHSMEEATRLCHRVAIIDQGRAIARGTPEELVASLGAEQIVELRCREERALEDLGPLPGVTQIRYSEGSTRLSVDAIGAALPALLDALARKGRSLRELKTHQPTLEDVFVHLTGRGLRDA